MTAIKVTHSQNIKFHSTKN